MYFTQDLLCTTVMTTIFLYDSSYHEYNLFFSLLTVKDVNLSLSLKVNMWNF